METRGIARRSPSGRRFALYLIICFAVALAALIYPIYIIQPFRAQGGRELRAALFVLRIRPWVEIAAAAFAIAALAQYWLRRPRNLHGMLAVLGALAVCGVAWLSHVNVYEIMFHPDMKPAFSAASASKLDGGEKVIAVKLGGAARAYPIRIISYHHIINDVLDGIPIAATY